MTRGKLLVTICQIEWSRSLEYAVKVFGNPFVDVVCCVVSHAFIYAKPIDSINKSLDLSVFWVGIIGKRAKNHFSLTTNGVIYVINSFVLEVDLC